MFSYANLRYMQNKAKSRLAHNRKKIYVKGLGYQAKDYQRNNVFSFVRAFTLSLALTGLCASFKAVNQPVELVSPFVSINYIAPKQAQAEEMVVEVKPTIEEYIKQVYGDQGETMVKVFTCESGLKPDTIGDKHIMGILDGEMIGDSVGIAQIRTGDAGIYDSKPWNRAKANGMTVEEFRTKLQDPYYNIDYSKQVYERQGFVAWYNCSKKVGAL